jgi:acyl-CoA reductase-like NAD-dependent aldehyde dehydrogenase
MVAKFRSSTAAAAGRRRAVEMASLWARFSTSMETLFVAALEGGPPMTDAPSPDPRIEAYLAQVRAALQRLPQAEIDEILPELRSHLEDAAGHCAQANRDSPGKNAADAADALDAAIESLGPPATLARRFLAGILLARAEGRPARRGLRGFLRGKR